MTAPSRLRALWGASHPGPTLVVTALAVALGVAAGLEPWRVVVLAFAVFAGQLSVGISNDAIDAARDRAVGRTDKPIARGDVSVRTAWTAAGLLVLVALVASAALGLVMAAVHALALASAWAYNAGLKNTPVSIAPFLVSFGLFPSLATLSASSPAFASPWATVTGAALGAAVHLTNVLPDLDDDAQTGVRGLPHRLGVRWAVILAVIGILVGALAVLLGPVLLGPALQGAAGVGPVAVAFFAAVAIVAGATLVLALTRRPTRALFRLTMLAALLLAVQLVATAAV
ncbi:UbiA family prenyltransferase [Microbacterium sp. LjRoot45]|uniref:UbiA family prenyltransferase n=1 Tax=Microbacterium sp. LjRoot45 TaxID=3342329 RepID=UPI003ED05BD7